MNIKTFDDYWLENGRILVANTISNLNKHIKNYSLYLDGLTGFYLVAGTTVGIVYIPKRLNYKNSLL